MTSPVLFSTGASPAAAGGSRNLVEFKAGKMEMRDKMVHPIKRQGLVYLRQSPDDNLMHFCWKDRQTGIVEDDLILFPDDCEFKRVKECTTGRVYVLKMKSSNRKMFFWMQESQAARDDEFCKKINEMLNNPPRAGSDMGGSSSDRDLQALFGNMTQEQVAQLLSSNGVNLASLLNSATGRSPSSQSASSTQGTTNSTTAPTTASSAGTNSQAQAAAANVLAAAAAASGRDSSPNINDFRSLIAGALDGEDDLAAFRESMGYTDSTPGGATGGGQPGAGSSGAESQGPLIDLSTAINSESLAHLLEDEEFLRKIEPHLPPVNSISSSSSSAPSAQQQQSLSPSERKRQFGETVRSSQFRSSLSQFCVALQSGQLGPLMSQFGLSENCVQAANLGNLEAFVKALDAQTRGSGAPASTPTSTAGSQQQQQQPQPPADRKDKS